MGAFAFQSQLTPATMQATMQRHLAAGRSSSSSIARLPLAAAPAPIGRARTVVVRAAVAAKPASLPVKSADGADVGTEELALKIARPEAAKGLVHRYVVYVMQNKRRVSGGMGGQPPPACRALAAGQSLSGPLPLLLPSPLLLLLLPTRRRCNTTGHSQHTHAQ
jgi:hypothetical protein